MSARTFGRPRGDDRTKDFFGGAEGSGPSGPSGRDEGYGRRFDREGGQGGFQGREGGFGGGNWRGGEGEGGFRSGGGPGPREPLPPTRADTESTWRSRDAPQPVRETAAPAGPSRADTADRWRRDDAPTAPSAPVPARSEEPSNWRGSAAGPAATDAGDWRAAGKEPVDPSKPKRWDEEESGLNPRRSAAFDKFGSGGPRRVGEDGAPDAPRTTRQLPAAFQSGPSRREEGGGFERTERAMPAAFQTGGRREEGGGFDRPERTLPAAFGSGPRRDGPPSRQADSGETTFTCKQTGETLARMCTCPTCREARQSEGGAVGGFTTRTSGGWGAREGGGERGGWGRDREGGGGDRGGWGRDREGGGGDREGGWGRDREGGGDRGGWGRDREGGGDRGGWGRDREGGGGGGREGGRGGWGDRPPQRVMQCGPDCGCEKCRAKFDLVIKQDKPKKTAPAKSEAPVAVAVAAPKVVLSEADAAAAVASFKTLLKRVFKNLEDVEDSIPETVKSIVKAKEVALDSNVATHALSFIAELTVKTGVARERKALLAVLKGLRNDLKTVLTTDAFVHGLEAAVSVARGGNVARLVELTDGLIAAGIVTVDALGASPVLTDFFSENGAARLVAGGDEAASGSAAAAQDAFAVAVGVVGTGQTGEELAKAAKAKLAAFSRVEASAGLMRAVLKAVGSTPGALDDPSEWTSEEGYGAALAGFLFDDEDGSTAALPACIAALCEVQSFCGSRGFPKGLIQGIFVNLHQNDVIAAAGFMAWKDDTGASLKLDGKGQALIQLTKWFDWLAEDEEEEEEDEEEGDDEEDMSDIIKPDNSKVLH